MLDTIEQSLEPNTSEKRSQNLREFADRINEMMVTSTELAKSISDVIRNMSELKRIDLELAKIKSDTMVKLATIKSDFEKFITKQTNIQETIFKILNILKQSNDKLLEKALNIDLSSCNEKEWQFVMDVINKTQHLTDRIMDILSKYIEK